MTSQPLQKNIKSRHYTITAPDGDLVHHRPRRADEAEGEGDEETARGRGSHGILHTTRTRANHTLSPDDGKAHTASPSPSPTTYKCARRWDWALLGRHSLHPLARGFPPHSPPPHDDNLVYLFTATVTREPREETRLK